MGTRTSHAPGTPSWVDLGSPDADAAGVFYSALFGWTHEEGDEESGGYGMFTLDGATVAGIGPQQNPDAPPFWMAYMTVADADATAALITGAGGTIVVDPMDVLDAGRMAVATDDQGVFFSIWQPKEHIGAQRVNDVGCFCWTELSTPDVDQAEIFYQRVFDWGRDEESSSDGAVVFTVDGRVVCGAHAGGADEFPVWSVWFTVPDADSAASKAADLGGAIMVPAADMSFGRGAIVADPHGAVFGIAALDQPDD